MLRAPYAFFNIFLCLSIKQIEKKKEKKKKKKFILENFPSSFLVLCIFLQQFFSCFLVFSFHALLTFNCVLLETINQQNLISVLGSKKRFGQKFLKRKQRIHWRRSHGQHKQC